jgi:hypothetical protein
MSVQTRNRLSTDRQLLESTVRSFFWRFREASYSTVRLIDFHCHELSRFSLHQSARILHNQGKIQANFWSFDTSVIYLYNLKSHPPPPYPRRASTQFWVNAPFSGFALTLSGHTTVGSTPLDELLARRRDPSLTTHNTHNRQTSTPTAGFEPTIPASERPKTHTSHRVATGISHNLKQYS